VRLQALAITPEKVAKPFKDRKAGYQALEATALLKISPLNFVRKPSSAVNDAMLDFVGYCDKSDAKNEKSVHW